MQLFLTLLMSFYLVLTTKEVARDPDSPGRDLAASTPHGARRGRVLGAHDPDVRAILTRPN
jgi:hypothetical protein